MPNISFRFLIALCGTLMVFAGTGAVAQQPQATFCMADGTRIVAEKFEVKDGAFLLYITGATAPMSVPATQVRGINTSDCASPPPFPRFGIHGSNTIGERLMPSLIEAFDKNRFNTRPQVTTLRPEELEIKLLSGQTVRGIIELRAHGSGTAAAGLISGDAQIGMASRRLNAKEVEDFKTRFNADPLIPGNEHVLALDGLAVIVNPANPVSQLSLDQIAKIFSGTIVNWRDVGGADRPIKVLRRDSHSGTFDTFNSLVLAPAHLTIAANAQQFESSENLSATVAKDNDAVGFIAVAYVDKAKALQIASSCGLHSSPTPFAVKSEEYPLARRLYLYTNGQPIEQSARDLLEFVRSDEAQTTVVENGFLDQSVEFQNENDQTQWARLFANNPKFALSADNLVPGSVAEAFGDAMQSMRRTTIAFRFALASSSLDTRAIQDVDRLAHYIRNHSIPAKRIFVVGFADSNGSWDRNYHLALERARQVASKLREIGVQLPDRSIKSMSYFAPVACNDTDAGTAKNRRVEVWIAR